jgi:hypothetical protein
MTDLEGLAWSQRVMGEAGPHIRAEASNILMATHNTVANLHVSIDLGRDDAYGLMWIKVPRALVMAFAGVGGVQPLHPKGAGYRVPVINGVPLVPWRYGKDRATNVDDVPFGVSDVRRSLFEPVGQLGLEVGEAGLGDVIVNQLSAEERRRLCAHLDAIRGLAADGQRIAVLAYASNPDALLRIYLGYADLGSDDRLFWAFREELPVPTTATVPGVPAVVPIQRPAFDSGPVGEPVLRPRIRKSDTP